MRISQPEKILFAVVATLFANGQSNAQEVGSGSRIGPGHLSTNAYLQGYGFQRTRSQATDSWTTIAKSTGFGIDDAGGVGSTISYAFRTPDGQVIAAHFNMASGPHGASVSSGEASGQNGDSLDVSGRAGVPRRQPVASSKTAATPGPFGTPVNTWSDAQTYPMYTPPAAFRR